MKFGHVTFFWNGNRSGCFNSEKEEYVEIPSDSGITFNEKPKMKAFEIGEKARDAILSGKFDQVNKSFSPFMRAPHDKTEQVVLELMLMGKKILNAVKFRYE